MHNLLTYFNETLQRRPHVVSFNIIGSATCVERLAPDDEVDIHIVMDRARPRDLQEAVNLALGARRVIGMTPHVETRRGPFRCRSRFQFHLIIDDLRTVSRTSAITLADWHRNSRLIVGEPIASYVRPELLASSFRREVQRTLWMLCHREIMYKRWVCLGDACELRECRRPIQSAAEYCELLKYAYKAMTSDLAALLRLGNDGVPTDSRLSTYVDGHKRAPTPVGSLSDWLRRVYYWNAELLRLAEVTRIPLTAQ